VSPLEAVRRVERELGEAGVASPRVDAEYLVAEALRRTRAELYSANGALSAEDLARLRSLAERRRQREPLAYILGEWGFRHLVLAVDRRVLVPRPETEVVVEVCLATIRHLPHPRVVDVGTGSGAIALAIADEHPGARVLAIDLSRDALEVAALNRGRTGLVDRVTLARTDLLHGLAAPVDLVVSNPPYIREHELDGIAPEVRDCDAMTVLRPGGVLVLESGDKQARGLAGHLGALGYQEIRVTTDLAGRERVVAGRLATTRSA
jgi:release factor glutamine methyltransferase